MISELKLKNFQSHRNTKLVFSRGFNAITGQTKSGKTRIIKALRWALENKPTRIRVAPKSDPQAKTIVTVKLVDNCIIKRIKSKNTNQYILIDKDKKKKKLKPFKTNVPDDIKKILKISSLNFQNQHDPPFLLSESPGARSRYLNKVVNLDVIDRSQKNIASRITNEHNLLLTHKEKAKELKKQLKEFDWLTDAEDQLRKLEIESRKIDHIERSVEELSEIVSTLEENKSKRNKFKKVTKYRSIVKKNLKLVEEIAGLEDKIASIEKMLDNIRDIKDTIISEKKRLQLLEKKFGKLMPERCPLCGR